MKDNQAHGSPMGQCHASPLAKVKRLGQQWQDEKDERVRQQLLIRMRETLSFLDAETRSQKILQACGFTM